MYCVMSFAFVSLSHMGSLETFCDGPFLFIGLSPLAFRCGKSVGFKCGKIYWAQLSFIGPNFSIVF